jgi:hypothetical protein
LLRLMVTLAAKRLSRRENELASELRRLWPHIFHHLEIIVRQQAQRIAIDARSTTKLNVLPPQECWGSWACTH